MVSSLRALVFGALVTTGTVAASGEEQCSSGECDTDLLSALQVHGKGDSSVSAGHACGDDCPLRINTPKDFTDALVSATTDKAVCKKSPKVASDLFGSIGLNGVNLDGRGVDFSDPTPPRTSSAMVFWSPSSALPGILEACCNSTSAGDCACQVTRKVGIPAPPGTELANQRFLVVKGNQNNQLASPTWNKWGSINTIKPSWDNLAKFTPDTFGAVFAGLDWKSKCPSGKISESVVADLNRFKKGCDDSHQEGTFLQFRDEFDVAHFKITCPKGCDSCSDNHEGPPSAEEFLDLVKGDTLCTDTAAVRSFMLWYYDANAFFLGTGFDQPTGDSPGGEESVTIPNLFIKQAGGRSSEFDFFSGAYTCQ